MNDLNDFFEILGILGLFLVAVWIWPAGPSFRWFWEDDQIRYRPK